MTIAIASARFTRPSNTTAYASGDLVANNTTAGSVVPMSFDLANLRGAQGFLLHSVTIKKTTATATAATFRLHLFRRSPTVTNGDNGALDVGDIAQYEGFVPLDMSTAAIDIVGTTLHLRYDLPLPVCIGLGGEGTLFGLLEARGAYAPGSAEQFSVSLGMRT